MAAYSLPSPDPAMLSRVAEIANWWGNGARRRARKCPCCAGKTGSRTIQASLAIEHNTLSLEQVTAVIDGKTCVGIAP